MLDKHCGKVLGMPHVVDFEERKPSRNTQPLSARGIAHSSMVSDLEIETMNELKLTQCLLALSSVSPISQPEQRLCGEVYDGRTFY